jgi:hypothetical protein
VASHPCRIRLPRELLTPAPPDLREVVTWLLRARAGRTPWYKGREGGMPAGPRRLCSDRASPALRRWRRSGEGVPTVEVESRQVR